VGVVEVSVGGEVIVTDGGLGLILTVVSNAGAQYQVGVVEVSVGGEVIVTDGGLGLILTVVSNAGAQYIPGGCGRSLSRG
jgi:hypothetical protein